VCGGEGELGTRCERDQRFRVEPAALARGDGDPLLGTVLGARFVVEAWLGLGSTAGLYRGRCLVSGTPCALKVLRDDGPTGALALELAAAEVPVVAPLELAVTNASAQVVGPPPTLAHFEGHRFAVAPRCAGREPELDDPEVLRRIGAFIGRLHAVGRQRRFEHRHWLDPHADGRRALGLLKAGGFVPPDQWPNWAATCEQALDLVDAAFAAAQPLATLRLHGDCHIGNVLWRDGLPNVVDLDDAIQGPAVQDLWMLVSGDPGSMAQQLNTLLDGYEQFSEFDDRERRLIEPLRTLRMLRHSAWLAERWTDPTFPLNFPFFGTAAYWNQQAVQLREQVEAMSA